MKQVLDYSLARPSPVDIVSSGYVGVVRYLAPAMDAPKIISAAEYSALRAAGLQVGLNWEWYGTRAQEGAAAGTADAQEALRQANALGYTGAIYFSVYYDAPESDQGAINAYFQACAAVIGLQRLGAYGGYWPLSRLFDAGLITYGWQASTWSGENRESRAHLFQTGATAFTEGADINEVLQANWTGGIMDPLYTLQADGGLLANGFHVEGWILYHILASVNQDALSLVLGLPQENNHDDPDGRWRQRFTYAIASQHDQNQSDFRFEPLPAPPTPPAVPEPVVPTIHSYTVSADDISVQQIAEKLKLGSWFSELYQPNMDEIETAARGAGHPNSDYGSTVVAGTVLHYRA